VLSKEDYILAELLGKNLPQVQALVAAANAGMEVHEMLRSMMRQKGWNPDDPPKFALPQEMSESDYIVGISMSGEVIGEDVGPSEIDLSSHIGVFGMTAVGKTTLVKLLLLEFAKKMRSSDEPKHTFLVLDVHGEYRDLLHLFEPEEAVWINADELGLNPFAIPTDENNKPVMPPEKWLNNIRELFRVLWLNEPSLNLLCEILLEEYERRGLLKGNE
jgi:type IV secretory pathway VirB4 component